MMIKQWMYIFVIKRLLNKQLIIFRNSLLKWTILWKIKTIEKRSVCFAESVWYWNKEWLWCSHL